MQYIAVLFDQPTKCISAITPEITPWSIGWEPLAYLILGVPEVLKRSIQHFRIYRVRHLMLPILKVG